MTPGTLLHHRARISKVARHLRDHLDEPINLAAMAKLAGLSSRQFERIFARVAGENPRAYLRRHRLERAAARLRASGASILTIAIEAGFESHEAFTRGFSQRFGKTPAAYRRLTNASVQPQARLQLWQLALAGGLRPHVENSEVL